MNSNNAVLKKHIAEALKHSLKCAAGIRTDTIQNYRFLHPRTLTPGEGNVTFHDLMLHADEFYASRTHLLVIRSRSLFIYSYTPALRFKLRKRVDVCYLLYKRAGLRRAVRFFMYRVFIDLVEQGVYRHEAWFEAAMAYLDIDQVDDVTEYANGIGVSYRWGTRCYFDDYLNPVGRDSLATKQEVLGDETQQISIGRRSIRFTKEGSSYVTKREVGAIKQYMAVRNTLFILTDKSLVIAEFV